MVRLVPYLYNNSPTVPLPNFPFTGAPACDQCRLTHRVSNSRLLQIRLPSLILYVQLGSLVQRAYKHFSYLAQDTLVIPNLIDNMLEVIKIVVDSDKMPHFVLLCALHLQPLTRSALLNHSFCQCGIPLCLYILCCVTGARARKSLMDSPPLH